MIKGLGMEIDINFIIKNIFSKRCFAFLCCNSAIYANCAKIHKIGI